MAPSKAMKLAKERAEAKVAILLTSAESILRTGTSRGTAEEEVPEADPFLFQELCRCITQIGDWMQGKEVLMVDLSKTAPLLDLLGELRQLRTVMSKALAKVEASKQTASPSLVSTPIIVCNEAPSAPTPSQENPSVDARQGSQSSTVTVVPQGPPSNETRPPVVAKQFVDIPGSVSTSAAPGSMSALPSNTVGGDMGTSATGVQNVVANMPVGNLPTLASSASGLYGQWPSQSTPGLGPYITSTSASTAPPYASQRTGFAVEPNVSRRLPSFDGKATGWPSYSRLFTKLVDQNVTIDDDFRLMLLIETAPTYKEELKGKSSYRAAWSFLQREFESPNKFIDELNALATDLYELRRPARVKDWNLMETAVQNIIDKLVGHGPSFENNLFNVLKRKLGAYMTEYHKEFRKDQSIKSLLLFIQDNIETQRLEDEVLSFNRVYAGQSSKPVPNAKSGAKVNSVLELDPCYFCNERHLRRECPYSKVARKQALRNANRCFRCLAPRVAGHTCTDVCPRCKAAANGLICPCLPFGQRGSGSGKGRPPLAKQAGTAQAQTHSSTPVAPKASQVVAVANKASAPTPPSTEKTHVVRVSYSNELREEVCMIREEHSYLPTILLAAINRETHRQIIVRVMLDSGSTGSFIADSIAAKLGLSRIRIDPVSLDTFGNTNLTQITHEVSVTLQSTEEPMTTHDVELLVMNGLFVGELPAPSPALQVLAHKCDINLSDTTYGDSTPVEILIGQDLYSDVFLRPNQKLIQPQKGIVFYQTRFGWILQGRPGGRTRRSPLRHRVAYMSTGPSEGQEIADYQNFTEQPHVCVDLNKLFVDPLAGDEETEEIQNDFVAEFCEQIRHDAQTRRYIVPLPWKGSERPDANYSAAVAQLHALRRRLEANDQLEMYGEVLMEFVREDYAEPVEKFSMDDGYYIPHFPVFRESSSTTPVRPVFNASACSRDRRSLNEAIHVGIWRQVQVSEMILRWRFHKFMVAGDIRKAFLQIQIEEQDRKYLRFLWVVADRVKVFQMKSLLFGAAASPFILHAVLKHLFATQAPDLSNIVADTYMDDAALFANSLPELKALVERVKQVLAVGSFELHKWLILPEVASALGLEEKRGDTVWLGSGWNLDDDVIQFSLPPRPTGPLTRRVLASFFAQPYDVLGLLGPYHTRARIFYRRVIENNHNWDEVVGEDDAMEASTIIDDIHHLSDIKFPRVVIDSSESSAYEIWGFGDASALAYGACFYVYDVKMKKARLLLSRSRLATKNKTIPQLELIAALLVVDTADRVKKCLYSDPICWRFFTDSAITLHRIRGATPNQDAFVKTRVQRILSLSSVVDWYHVVSNLNPADVLSRGISLRLLKRHELWFNGPDVETILGAGAHTERILTRHVNDVILLDKVYAGQVRASGEPASNTKLGAQVNAAQELERCLFCDELHHRRGCPYSKMARKRALRDKGLCIRCLAPRDSNHSCAVKCTRCKGAHNRLICMHKPWGGDSDTSTEEDSAESTSTDSYDTEFSAESPVACDAATEMEKVVRMAPVVPQTERPGSREHDTPTERIHVVLAAPVVSIVETECPVVHDSPTEIGDVMTPGDQKGNIGNGDEENVSYLPVLQLGLLAKAYGCQKTVRALIDTGSSESVISESVVKRLDLPRTQIDPIVPIVFGNRPVEPIIEEATLFIQPRHPGIVPVPVREEVRLLVWKDTLTGKIPAPSPALRTLAKQNEVILSDGALWGTESIDVIIGQNLYSDVFLKENLRTMMPQPGITLVETRFGWTLQGNVSGTVQNAPTSALAPSSSQQSCHTIPEKEPPSVCAEMKTRNTESLSTESGAVVCESIPAIASPPSCIDTTPRIPIEPLVPGPSELIQSTSPADIPISGLPESEHGDNDNTNQMSVHVICERRHATQLAIENLSATHSRFLCDSSQDDPDLLLSPLVSIPDNLSIMASRGNKQKRLNLEPPIDQEILYSQAKHLMLLSTELLEGEPHQNATRQEKDNWETHARGIALRMGRVAMDYPAGLLDAQNERKFFKNCRKLDDILERVTNAQLQSRKVQKTLRGRGRGGSLPPAERTSHSKGRSNVEEDASLERHPSQYQEGSARSRGTRPPASRRDTGFHLEAHTLDDEPLSLVRGYRGRGGSVPPSFRDTTSLPLEARQAGITLAGHGIRADARSRIPRKQAYYGCQDESSTEGDSFVNPQQQIRVQMRDNSRQVMRSADSQHEMVHLLVPRSSLHPHKQYNRMSSQTETYTQDPSYQDMPLDMTKVTARPAIQSVPVLAKQELVTSSSPKRNSELEKTTVKTVIKEDNGLDASTSSPLPPWPATAAQMVTYLDECQDEEDLLSRDTDEDVDPTVVDEDDAARLLQRSPY